MVTVASDLPVDHGVMTKKLSLAVLVLFLALIGAEFFLRHCTPIADQRSRTRGLPQLYRRSEIPGLEYEHKPGATVRAPAGWEVHTNSHGMRSPEVTLTKAVDVVRIAAVGDSFTFGEGVGDLQSFPSYLRGAIEKLSSRAKHFEVLNFGVSGYSTTDEAALVEARVLAFDPDLVLLGYVLNDPDPHPSHGLHAFWHEPFWWEHSELTRLIGGFLVDLERRRLGYAKEEHFGFLHDPRASYWETVVNGLERLRACANQAGVPVVVVIFPLVSGWTWESYPFDPLHELVRVEAEKNGFRVLDLKQELVSRIERPKALSLENNPHANPKGNRAFARIIAEYLAEEVLPGLME